MNNKTTLYDILKNEWLCSDEVISLFYQDVMIKDNVLRQSTKTEDFKDTIVYGYRNNNITTKNQIKDKRKSYRMVIAYAYDNNPNYSYISYTTDGKDVNVFNIKKITFGEYVKFVDEDSIFNEKHCIDFGKENKYIYPPDNKRSHRCLQMTKVKSFYLVNGKILDRLIDEMKKFPFSSSRNTHKGKEVVFSTVIFEFKGKDKDEIFNKDNKIIKLISGKPFVLFFSISNRGHLVIDELDLNTLKIYNYKDKDIETVLKNRVNRDDVFNMKVNEENTYTYFNNNIPEEIESELITKIIMDSI